MLGNELHNCREYFYPLGTKNFAALYQKIKCGIFLVYF